MFEGIGLDASPTMHAMRALIAWCTSPLGAMTVAVQAIPKRHGTVFIVWSDEGQRVGVQRPFCEGERLQRRNE